MFGKLTTPLAGERHGHSVLQEGVAFRGEFEAKGDVRLDGRLEGKLVVENRLTIGACGQINADVEAAEIVVMGAVRGSVFAHRRLELRKGALLVGNVTTPVLVVEEGVHFHGSSNMSPQGESTPIEPTILSKAERSEPESQAMASQGR